MKTDQYYALIDEKEQGPFTLQELHGMRQRGGVRGDTLCAQSGETKWTALGELLKAAEPAKKDDLAGVAIVGYSLISIGIFAAVIGGIAALEHGWGIFAAVLGGTWALCLLGVLCRILDRLNQIAGKK
jgi:hypothetical protein